MVRKAVGAIVFQGDCFLLVHKVKINAGSTKEDIIGEWDVVKGGVEDSDKDLQSAVLRELIEETSSSEFQIIKQLPEKICFDFPEETSRKIGFKRQETTMFLVEFFGDRESLNPTDNEIDKIRMLNKEEVMEKLSHADTVEYFNKYIFHRGGQSPL